MTTLKNSKNKQSLIEPMELLPEAKLYGVNNQEFVDDIYRYDIFANIYNLVSPSIGNHDKAKVMSYKLMELFNYELSRGINIIDIQNF